MKKHEVPKYIKDKCHSMERLCEKARLLKIEVEKWCEENGIDTCSNEWEQDVRNELGGCDFILDVDAIENLLNQN